MKTSEIIQLMNASFEVSLTPVEELIIATAWENKTYKTIAANESHYSPEYIRITAASLWENLSDKLGISLKKSNFKEVFESRELRIKLQKLKQQKELQQQALEIFNTQQNFENSYSSMSAYFHLKSPFYISRSPLEEIATYQLKQPGGFVFVAGGQNAGKTSLILQVLDFSSQNTYETIYLDLKEISMIPNLSFDYLLNWLCKKITQKLKIPAKIQELWQEELGSKINTTLYFENYILLEIQTPLILALDNFDHLCNSVKFAEDFLLLLKFWHQQSQEDALWKNLRILLATSLENADQLAFNNSPDTGEILIKLPPFTPQQVEQLAHRYGLTWFQAEFAQKVIQYLGSNPYLLQITLSNVANSSPAPLEQQQRLEYILNHPLREIGIYQTHLQTLLNILETDLPLKSAFQKIIKNFPEVNLENQLKLKLEDLGLIQPQNSQITISSQLYQQYFEKQFQQEQRMTEVQNFSAQAYYPPQSHVPLFVNQSCLHRKTPKFLSSKHLNYLSENPSLIGRCSTSTDLHYKTSFTWKENLEPESEFEQYLTEIWQDLSQKRMPLSMIVCAIDSGEKHEIIDREKVHKSYLLKIDQTIQNLVQPMRHFMVPNEFSQWVILLPETQSVTAFFWAEKIRQQIKQLTIIGQGCSISKSLSTSPMLTVSLGITCSIPSSSLSPHLMLEETKQTLLRTQKRGGDAVKISSMFNVGFLSDFKLAELGCRQN